MALHLNSVIPVNVSTMEARFARYDEVCIEKLRVIHVDKDKIVGVLYSGAELKELRDHLYQLNFWFSTRNVEKYSKFTSCIGAFHPFCVLLKGVWVFSLCWV